MSIQGQLKGDEVFLLSGWEQKASLRRRLHPQVFVFVEPVSRNNVSRVRAEGTPNQHTHFKIGLHY